MSFFGSAELLLFLSLVASKSTGQLQTISDLHTNTTCQNCTLRLENLCPNISWLTKNVENESSGSEIWECSPNSEKCNPRLSSGAELLGIRQTNMSWNRNSSLKCTKYYFTWTAFLKIQKSEQKEALKTETGAFFQIAFQQTFGLECLLTVQEYGFRLTEQDEPCVSNTNLTSLLNPPHCFSYPCSDKSNVLSKFEVNVEKWAELVSEERVIQAETKQSEIRRVERAEWVRRVRKPINWNWKDHVLELTVLAIVVAILLLIGLKICLAEKVMDAYQNARMTMSKKRGVKFSRCGLPRHNSKPNGFVYDLSRHPNKSILKNWQKEAEVPFCDKNTKLTMSREIRSFESNSSIYYDTLEYPESESVSSDSFAQPLISTF